MTQTTHPLLGPIDPSKPGQWGAEVSFAGRTVTIDLTIEEPDLPPSSLEGLPQSLADVEALDRAARAALLSDAKSQDPDAAAVIYLTHHHTELSSETYLRLFGVQMPNLAAPAPLLERMKLVRIGLYPEDEDRRILLDYSIDPDMTHYLLCVAFDVAGQVSAVDLES
jgi:Protein of unknown function (DUF2004)